MKALKTKGLVQDYLAMPRFSIWYLTDLGKAFTEQKIVSNISYSFSLASCDDETFNHTSGLSCIEAKYDLIKKSDPSFKSYFCEKESISFFDTHRNNIKQKKTSFFRIPDSFFEYQEPGDGSLQTHAVELELFIKAKHRYFKIYHFYRDYPSIHRVYWITFNDRIKASLIKTFNEFYEKDKRELDMSIESNKIKVERGNNIHRFIKYSDFIENGFGKT